MYGFSISYIREKYVLQNAIKMVVVAILVRFSVQFLAQKSDFKN